MVVWLANAIGCVSNRQDLNLRFFAEVTINYRHTTRTERKQVQAVALPRSNRSYVTLQKTIRQRTMLVSLLEEVTNIFGTDQNHLSRSG